MSASHKVKLTVSVVMTEMDGSVEESAELARDLVEEAVHTHWDAEAVVDVEDYRELVS